MRFGATGCASGLAMLRKSPVICGLGEDEGGGDGRGGGEGRIRLIAVSGFCRPPGREGG